MDAEFRKLNDRLDRIERLTELSAKNILSVKEAALLIGRSEKTVYNRLDEIPHYRGPMGITIRRDELEDWMCEVKCTPVRL